MRKSVLIFCFSWVILPMWAQQKTWNLSDVIITQLTDNTYVHTSYLQTNDFGKVACNGLIVRDGQDVVIFDTPTDDAGSQVLMKWINNTLHANVKYIIPTHFHNDCLGGLQAFHAQGISSVANQQTIELARGSQAIVPKQGFSQQITLPIGKEQVDVRYFGPGHTQDNVVGYFEKEQVLFGGCLIKEIDASKGFLGDADVLAWSATVQQVKRAYPKLTWVVPGHGKSGNVSLLDYTIQLFSWKN